VFISFFSYNFSSLMIFHSNTSLFTITHFLVRRSSVVVFAFSLIIQVFSMFIASTYVFNTHRTFLWKLHLITFYRYNFWVLIILYYIGTGWKQFVIRANTRLYITPLTITQNRYWAVFTYIYIYIYIGKYGSVILTGIDCLTATCKNRLSSYSINTCFTKSLYYNKL